MLASFCKLGDLVKKTTRRTQIAFTVMFLGKGKGKRFAGHLGMCDNIFDKQYKCQLNETVKDRAEM